MTSATQANRRLRVLVVPSRYPSPAQPFLATPLREQVRAISLLNDVVVLDAPREAFSRDRAFFSTRDIDDGIPVIRSRFRQSPVPKTTYMLFLASMISAGRRIVREGFQPDLIHAHMYFVAFPAIILGKWLRVPVVITEHSECYAGRLPWRIRQEARVAFRLADAVIPVSDHLRSLMEGHGIRGVFRVVPNAVDTEVFIPREDPPDPLSPTRRLLFVGRLLPVKGVDVLLNGLALLSKVRRDFTMDILGDSDHRAEYESLACRLGVEHLVRFHGFQPREVVADFMRHSHVLVLPSRSENSPTVLVEALASGLPMVASNVGGVPEVVPKTMGVFFPKEDPAALAEALTWMLDHLRDYDQREMAKYARTNFSLEVIGKQVDEVYRRVLAERG